MTFYFKLTEVSSKLPCRGHVGNLTLNASPRNRSPFIYSENVYPFYDGALWMDFYYVLYNTKLYGSPELGVLTRPVLEA